MFIKRHAALLFTLEFYFTGGKEARAPGHFPQPDSLTFADPETTMSFNIQGIRRLDKAALDQGRRIWNRPVLTRAIYGLKHFHKNGEPALSPE